MAAPPALTPDGAADKQGIEFMKNDEDIWISCGTEASQPDEFGPAVRGSRVAGSVLGGSPGQAERKWVQPVLSVTAP